MMSTPAPDQRLAPDMAAVRRGGGQLSLTDLLVAVGRFESVQEGDAAQQGTAPPRDDPFLHCCPGGVESVRHPVLFLVHFYI